MGSGVTEVCEAAVPAGSSAVVQCRAAFLSIVCRRRQHIRCRNHGRRNKLHLSFLVTPRSGLLSHTNRWKRLEHQTRGLAFKMVTGGRTPFQLRRSDVQEKRGHGEVDYWFLCLICGCLTSGVAGLFGVTSAVQLHVPDHQEVLTLTADFKFGSCNTNTPVTRS